MSNAPFGINLPALHEQEGAIATQSNPKKAASEIEGFNPIPWLSPEQAARIYRGSAPQ